jgi:hypothetical protein
MRYTREATVWSPAGPDAVPGWVLHQIVSQFVAFARDRLPGCWQPIAESEQIHIERTNDGYRLHWSVEVDS